MGEVYLAKDSRLDRKVALKFLSNKFIDDAWAKRQLVKEAQAAAKLTMLISARCTAMKNTSLQVHRYAVR